MNKWRRRNLIAVTTVLSVTALNYGLMIPLLALMLNNQGVDGTLIGLNTATQALAVFFVAPFATRLMRSPGPAPVILYSLAFTVALLLLLPLFDNITAWFPLRFALGAAGGLLWIAGEAWVNQIAEERSRGRMVAVYHMAILTGFSIGPLVLVVTGVGGWTPFLVAAGITALSMLPLLLVLKEAPKLEGQPSASLPRFLVLAPVAMFICLVFGASEGVLLTFLPIYGLHVGLLETVSLSLLVVMGVGGIAFQLPIGWLADHMDRRLLTLLCTLLVIAAAAAMPFVISYPPWNWIYAFVFGGVTAGLYTVALVLVGERFQGADLAAASTVFGVMWGLGSVIGPPLGGAAMELWVPHGLPAALMLMYLVLFPLTVVSYFRGARARAA